LGDEVSDVFLFHTYYERRWRKNCQ
jgi:hypothetical protein